MTRHFCILFTVLILAGASLRADTTNIALAKASVLDGNVVYLLVGQVSGGLVLEIQATQKALAVTNRIIGTVLDLRFAGGDDLASAKAAAELFAARKPPLAILVNGGTRGAAAALAKALRDARDGLVLGDAAAPVAPDIAVAVKLADEKDYLKNPYGAPAADGAGAVGSTSNNLATFIDHTSEADLVREKIKDGEQDEDLQPAHPSEPPKPYIHDPVLARAVDLIKALAVLRPAHG